MEAKPTEVMTEQEFENCRDALLMAAKMISDQPVEQFASEAWREWDKLPSRQAKQIARIADACSNVKYVINYFNPPPEP